MPHLDQHSALPPESIMGCDNTPHFGLFIIVDDGAGGGGGWLMVVMTMIMM